MSDQSVLPDMLRGALLAFPAAAAPGPYQAVLLARSLRLGPARALPLALVPTVSDPVIIAAVLAVLTQLPGGFLRILTVASAVVVLWLAVSTLRGALRPAPGGPAGPAGPGGAPERRGFWALAAVNVTNPNAWVFWSAVGGPIVAQSYRAAPAGAAAFLVSFFACLAAGNAVLVLLAGGIARAGPRAARLLGVASGLALLGFGAWQLLRALGPRAG